MITIRLIHYSLALQQPSAGSEESRSWRLYRVPRAHVAVSNNRITDGHANVSRTMKARMHINVDIELY